MPVATVWESEETMNAFYASSVYAELDNLSCSNQYPCFSLEQVSYGLMRNLNGLVALTAVFPSSSVSDSSEFENAFEAAFSGWYPAGCKFKGGMVRFFSQTWARSKPVKGVESQATVTQDTMVQEVYYHIFRWNENCGSPENAAAAARDPAALQSWESAIAKVGESIESWKQELWEIEWLFWC
jgi:hypothetical protein